MRCAIYPRVSTDRQRERHTIDSQLRILPEHAERQGWTVLDPRRYVDDGKSGEDVVGRPGFTKLLDDAARGLIDVVLVIDLDRVTRSRKSAEGALIFDQLREYGVKLATPSQGIIDLDDEDQDLLVQIKREVAKWEKRKIVRRMLRGKREAAKRGGRVPGPDPYGLRWVKNDADARRGAYEIEREEADVVRSIYALAIDGLGINMIVWQLNSEGKRTRDMKRGSRPMGGAGAWSTSTIGKLLHSTTYKGEYRVFEGEADIPPTPVPAIVNAETWALAQAALKRRKPETRWKHDRRYLLSGIVRCGECGYAMWVVNARPHRHGQHAYYRCSSSNSWRKMKMTGPCGNRHHRVDTIDVAVWGKVAEVLRDPKLLAVACALGVEGPAVDWAAQVESARRKLGELEKLEGDVLRRQRHGLLSSAAGDRELGEIAGERRLAARSLQLAEHQFGDAASRQRGVNDLEAQAAALAARVDTATFQERRSLVLALVPTEHGGVVKLHQDGSVVVREILPTAATAETRRHAGSR